MEETPKPQFSMIQGGGSPNGTTEKWTASFSLVPHLHYFLVQRNLRKVLPIVIRCPSVKRKGCVAFVSHKTVNLLGLSMALSRPSKESKAILWPKRWPKTSSTDG